MDPTEDGPQIGSEGASDGQSPAQPASPTPSVYLFRGALLALAIGTMLALYLVLAPPATESVQSQVLDVATSTPAAVDTATPTPENQQPTSTPTAFPETPTPDGTAETPQPEPGTLIEYTIVSGDFLSTIADTHGTTVDAILELNPDLEPDQISVGQVIRIPSQ